MKTTKTAQTMEKLRLTQKNKHNRLKCKWCWQGITVYLGEEQGSVLILSWKTLGEKASTETAYLKQEQQKSQNVGKGKIGHENLYSLKHPSPNRRELPWGTARLWAGHLINTQVVLKKRVSINNSNKYIHSKGTLRFNACHTSQLLCLVGEKKKKTIKKRKITSPLTLCLSIEADEVTLLPLLFCFSAINSFIFSGILDNNFLSIQHSALINSFRGAQ